jgi:hypothetical protein
MAVGRSGGQQGPFAWRLLADPVCGHRSKERYGSSMSSVTTSASATRAWRGRDAQPGTTR